MTRKTCTNHPHVDIVLQSVCHELNSFDCYGQSKNVKSRRHKQDISPNLLNLKHLYRTDPAVALFLKINGIDLSENWSDQKFCSMTRNRMTRSQTNSVCCKAKAAPGGEYAHRLRTRRHTVFTSNFADTSGDDDSNHIKPMRELRSSSRLALALVKSVEREERTTRPRRNLKPKRISADERLVVDNKSYYKVELLTNKLRSSAVYNRELDGARLKKSKSPPTECDESEDDKVTFTTNKIRDYELIRLNNEAENFLFPNKEETTSEDEVDSDKKVEATPVTHHRSFKNVKCEPEEESSMDSIFSDTSTSRKKRRLTQAESFILDNQKYYKFETPGSRLRYQGSYLAPVPPKSNGEHGSAKSKCKESKDKDKDKDREKESKRVEEDSEQIKLNLEEVKFSFELVPNKEPWYETFQRQDVAQECYSCYNYNTGFYKPFLMPYEMGPLPPLDPNYCMYEYNLVRQPLINSESQIHNDDSSSNDTLKIDECSSSYEDTKSSDDTLNSELTLNELFSSNNNIKRTYRRRLFNNTRNPRKSPRQHASTLAILSSFIHQRKRREIHKLQAAAAAATTPKPAAKLDLSVISEVEAEEKKEEPPVDYDSIFNDIDEMLTNNYEELDDDLISQEDGFEFDVHCALDPVEMLEDCIKCKHKEEVLKDATKESLGKSAKSGKLLTTTGRKTGRKRKKNRTGWPNKNKRVLFRKDDNVANNAARNKVNHAKQLEKLLEEIKTNDDELNGNVEPIKINGCADLKTLLTTTTPKRKENRVSSSENCAEVVIASMNDKLDCVNVDLDKWENAERVLSAKLRTESINNDIQFQPIVRVQKLDTDVSKLLQNNVVTTTPARKSTKKSRRMPASPKSPKMFRKPRGACYRERYSERIHYN